MPALSAATKEIAPDPQTATLAGYIVGPKPADDTALGTATPWSGDLIQRLMLLRLSIERELRGDAELARMGDAASVASRSIFDLQKELGGRGLLPSDLAAPLWRVLLHADRVIHGAVVEPGTNDVVAELGPRLVTGLRRMRHTPNWLHALVATRAGENTKWSAAIDHRAIGEIEVEVPPGIIIPLMARSPSAGFMLKHLERNLPLAWISGDQIYGTRAAKESAPWLIDQVILPMPKRSHDSLDQPQ